MVYAHKYILSYYTSCPAPCFFSYFLFFYFFYFLFFLWLCWVFVSVRGLSLVVASGGHSSTQCAGLSLSWPLLLWSTGSGRAGSVIVAHGPSCSAACGIFPDQGSNPCPLHWQADSQPLCHQGSPFFLLLNTLRQYFFHFFKYICAPTKYNKRGQETVTIRSYEMCLQKLKRASLVARWLGVCLPMQGT